MILVRWLWCRVIAPEAYVGVHTKTYCPILRETRQFPPKIVKFVMKLIKHWFIPEQTHCCRRIVHARAKEIKRNRLGIHLSSNFFSNACFSEKRAIRMNVFMNKPSRKVLRTLFGDTSISGPK